MYYCRLASCCELVNVWQHKNGHFWKEGPQVRHIFLSPSNHTVLFTSVYKSYRRRQCGRIRVLFFYGNRGYILYHASTCMEYMDAFQFIMSPEHSENPLFQNKNV